MKGRVLTANPTLRMRIAGGGESLTVRPERLIVAGYTGSDEAAVAAHIAELAEIGIPAPRTVPEFYDLDPALLTTAATVPVVGAVSSGEVEPVLIRTGGKYYLGVGSDHTDRELERADIAKSKAACPKPVSDTVLPVGELSTMEWDDVTAESYVDGVGYQRGVLGALRHPADLVRRLVAALGEPVGDLVLYCGTLPLLTGQFRYGLRWTLRLGLPDGTVLEHAYDVDQGALDE